MTRSTVLSTTIIVKGTTSLVVKSLNLDDDFGREEEVESFFCCLPISSNKVLSCSGGATSQTVPYRVPWWASMQQVVGGRNKAELEVWHSIM